MLDKTEMHALLSGCRKLRVRLQNGTVEIRVGILARLRVIDPSFFLWTHKFQLKLTITRPLDAITRPLGRASIHNGVKISHGKSLTMFHFCPPNYQNIELHVLN